VTFPAATETIEPLALPNTDWLYHRLSLTGPDETISAFRLAAAGSGTIPWHLDLDRLQEDWFHWLIQRRDAAAPGLSAAGAHVLSAQLRDAVGRRHELAVARVGRSFACAFDLHALLPVPDTVLRLGPDDPRSLAWLWQHWGTTQALRHVQDVSRPRGQRADFTFWSADWTPWRALSALAGAWPALRFEARPSYDGP
jgi:hypothetical protein